MNSITIRFPVRIQQISEHEIEIQTPDIPTPPPLTESIIDFMSRNHISDMEIGMLCDRIASEIFLRTLVSTAQTRTKHVNV